MNVVAAPKMKTALGACALLACAVALAAAPARAQGGRDAASGFAEVNGTRLWYETAGKGSTVVLVHGGLVDSRLWDDQMKELAKRHRVVRYDLRGYGKSAAPTADFSPVEDLRALLAFLKVERATVVGLSLGGIIAADFALEHPRMTEGLVLVGAGLRGDKQPPDPKSMEAYRASVREGAEKFAELAFESPLFAGVKEKPRAHARLREMLLANAPALQHLFANRLKYPEPETIDRLGDIRVPTLVVVGDRDGPNLLNIADTLHAKIPGARKSIIRDASHHPPVETPQEFNRVLLDFLRQPRR
jgi:pimeloyl-ACP methyl ester carboxylesterase